MASEVSVDEIKRDITALYSKIERCNHSKGDLLIAIQKEKETITELQFYIRENTRRIKLNQPPVYDNEAMENDIIRCHANMELFEKTIRREDDTIADINHMITVLEEDLARPKEIRYDATTGNVLTIVGDGD